MGNLVLSEPNLASQLEHLAHAQNVPPEDLLSQAVSEFLASRMADGKFLQPKHTWAPPEFLTEAAAFERLKPELMNKYPGRVVAIYQEKVAHVGDDILEVHEQVMQQYGFVPCYVERVVAETPHRVRMPSIRKARL
ncbi:MAG: hypothetical protein R2911_13060 [Caldilineaceae bacterium]